jgi:hypothetical protein
MKIFYGFINFRRSFDNTRKTLESLNITNKEDHLILSKTTGLGDFNDKEKYNFKVGDKSLPICFNTILKAAKDAGSDYCFLIADDVEVKDTSVFQKYIDLSQKFEQDVVFYPYNRNLNVALDKFPNPIARIKIGAEEFIDIQRFPDSDFMCVKISADEPMPPLFDERLEALYLDYFINDCVKMGKVKSFGFFLDIHNSHEYLGRTQDKTIKEVFTDVQVQKDTQAREGEQLALSNDLDSVVNHIRLMTKE